MLTEATLSNLPPVSARLKFAASIASNVPLEAGADGAAKAGQSAETTHACIAETTAELKLVVDEAKSILDVEKVIASILLMEDLRIQKN